MSRSGTTFYTKERHNGKDIVHKLALTPVIPRGWMVFIDDKPGFGSLVMSWQEAFSELQKLKRMLDIKNLSVPGTTSWVVDTEQKVAPITKPRNAVDSVAVENDSENIKEASESMDTMGPLEKYPPTGGTRLLNEPATPAKEEIICQEKPLPLITPGEEEGINGE